MNTVGVLAAITLISTTALAGESPQEKLVLDRDGIKVWTHRVPNNPLLNFRATTEIESTLSGAVALVMDVEHAADWAPNAGKVLILDRDDLSGNYLLRMDLDFPFPLKNRDVVIASHLSQSDDGIVTIKNEVISDPRVPERKDFIRITRYEGIWQFKPLISPAGKPSVEVTVSGFADPRGMLPTKVINLFIQEQPFKMLLNMKDYVKSARYQQATVAVVKEMS